MSGKTTKKRGLGKGLGALLEDPTTDITVKSKPSKNTETAGSVAKIEIKNIEVNPFQPRVEFEKEALAELVSSIKEHGIIQPITVRKLGYNKFQIISGERRYRASQIAGLKEVPTYIRIANDQAMLEMAIVENVQRKDLNAIEVATSFQRLLDECNLTQEQLSEKVGKNRSTVTNFLRLLKLPDAIQVGVRDQKISMGHARALIGIQDEKKQYELFDRVIAESLSVRKLEELISNYKTENLETAADKPVKSNLRPEEIKLREDLAFRFNSKIDIKKTAKGNGKLVIPFKSEEHLERIMGLLEQ